MASPLALLVYERLLPGGQLVNQLQDRGYRVQSLADPAALVEHAEREKPLLVMIDVEERQEAACEAIARLRRHGPTAHIPVIAITAAANAAGQQAARAAGAKLVVFDAVILAHLDQFIQQALEVE